MNDDDAFEVESGPPCRSIDRTGMLHESSDGMGHKSRKITTGLGQLEPFLRIEEFWLEQPILPINPWAGLLQYYYVFPDSPNQLRIRDSFNSTCVVEPGAALSTATGTGLWMEVTPEHSGKLCHGMLITLNLAASDKSQPPSRLLFPSAAIPEVAKGPLINVRVLAGTYENKTAMAAAGPPYSLLDVSLAPGASIRRDIPRDHIAFVAVLKGKALIGGADDPRTVRAGVAVSLFDDGDSIFVRAAEEKCHAIIGTARPLGEPIFVAGGFVMNHPQQLAEAEMRMQIEQMGTLLPRG